MASTHPLVERFRQGDVPAPLKAAAARGALPLPPEDLLEVLFHLRREPAKDLQQDIVRTIEGIPLEVVQGVAASPETAAPMLDFLARANIRRDIVLEKIAMNPGTADATLGLLAQHGSESILEFLSFNQARLTRAPAILQAMLQSPRCSQSIRRRLQEIWALHQQELALRARAAAAAPAPAPATETAPQQAPSPAAAVAQEPAEPLDEAAAVPSAGDAAAAAAEEDVADVPMSLDDLANLDLNAKILEEMAQDEDVSEEDLRLAQKLLTMTVPEKVQLALKGDRQARMVLIRDASKLVQEAVIQSPKITDNEIEQIAKLRSISVDVIRALINKREAMKSNTVVVSLVRNPKCPPPDAMQLMHKLQDRELTHVSKDKNVPDIIRRHALIILDKRKPKGLKKTGH